MFYGLQLPPAKSDRVVGIALPTGSVRNRAGAVLAARHVNIRVLLRTDVTPYPPLSETVLRQCNGQFLYFYALRSKHFKYYSDDATGHRRLGD